MQLQVVQAWALEGRSDVRRCGSLPVTNTSRSMSTAVAGLECRQMICLIGTSAQIAATLRDLGVGFVGASLGGLVPSQAPIVAPFEPATPLGLPPSDSSPETSVRPTTSVLPMAQLGMQLAHR